MKTCTRCGEAKPLDDFRTRTRRGRTEPLPMCRTCEREYRREWLAANPDKRREYKRRHREGHRDEVNAYKREYRATHPEHAEHDRAKSLAWSRANRDKIREYNRRPDRRDARLRRAHGISLAQFHEMWERQGGRCPICLRELPREFLTREELHASPVKPHVDHCHTTEVVRGILCSTCNQAIGHLREEPGNFARAVEYLSGKYPTIMPNRVVSVPNGSKTECKRGHDFTPENTRWDRGRRHCRTCDQGNARAAYLANPKPYDCPDCGAPTAKSGTRCRTCAGRLRRGHRVPVPTCRDCGTPVSRRDVERCRSCAQRRRYAVSR